jgi:hypothetical protein
LQTSAGRLVFSGSDGEGTNNTQLLQDGRDDLHSFLDLVIFKGDLHDPSGNGKKSIHKDIHKKILR